MLFDYPLEKLRTYLPERNEPKDFDAFWQQTLADAQKIPLNAKFEPVDYGLKLVETFDVTFNGYGGQPVKGWLILPRVRSSKLPCVVEYIGYGGGRGFPTDWLLWSNAGYAHFVMDTRGQGSKWRQGDTADVAVDGSNPYHPGFMTQGILNPKTYYYRRVFVDAVRAIHAARSHPAVDAESIAATGTSQGGGLTIAVSGLEPSIKVAMADVPFLCHYHRAVTITNNLPYNEIALYCKVHRDKVTQVFNTLEYFDGMHFAVRAQAKALFSTALMDLTCPPSTVFAAYNHYAGPKQITVYEFNEHEGGEGYQAIEKVQFLRGIWG
jgi:cephalosporin-C deacetylase